MQKCQTTPLADSQELAGERVVARTLPASTSTAGVLPDAIPAGRWDEFDRLSWRRWWTLLRYAIVRSTTDDRTATHREDSLSGKPASGHIRRRGCIVTSNLTNNWWSLLARGMQHVQDRRSDSIDLLDWGRRFLPQHFVAPPSAMHCWLAQQLDTLHTRRGTKLNVIGPRGGAKSTIASLAYVLRIACEAWEPYVWIVSDTRQQAQMHLENIKAELTGNPRLADAYPRACGAGPRWQAAAIELKNGVAIEAYGTGQRIRGRRRNEHRPTLIVCDDIQNDSHMSSAVQRANSRNWFHGTLLKAGTPRTNLVNLATALHRDALAMELQNHTWLALEAVSSRRALARSRRSLATVATTIQPRNGRRWQANSA